MPATQIPLRTNRITLESRVLLQKESRTSDGAGGYTARWTTVASPFANVVQAGGGERLEGGQDPSRRTFSVTLRRRTDLSGALRVCWGSVVMGVVSVKQDDEDRDYSVLSCVEEPGAAR